MKEQVARFTGKDFLAVAKHADFKFSYFVHEILTGNKAALIEDKLFVSPSVKTCLDDPDTYEETMNSLMIVRLPKMSMMPSPSSY